MRTVYLLRHAKSDWSAGTTSDHARPLNARGRRACRSLGAYLAESGISFDRVYCSTASRTRETWTRVAREGGYGAIPVQFVDALYEATAARVMSVVQDAEPSVRTILVIGHEPSMSGTLGLFSGGATGPYPTGTLVRLDFPAAGTWLDCRPGAGRSVLRVEPRSLDSE